MNLDEWIEYHNEEYQKAEKISKLLGINHIRVLTTSHEKLIDMLVAKIELKNALLESIEQFLEVHKR